MIQRCSAARTLAHPTLNKGVVHRQPPRQLNSCKLKRLPSFSGKRQPWLQHEAHACSSNPTCCQLCRRRIITLPLAVPAHKLPMLSTTTAVSAAFTDCVPAKLVVLWVAPLKNSSFPPTAHHTQAAVAAPAASPSTTGGTITIPVTLSWAALRIKTARGMCGPVPPPLLPGPVPRLPPFSMPASFPVAAVGEPPAPPLLAGLRTAPR